MSEDPIADARLREFLLGKVDDTERERIESLFLIDPETKERVLAAEQDLIEDYLESGLAPADMKRFRSRYARTAEQQRRLRIAASIKEWAATQAVQ